MNPTVTCAAGLRSRSTTTTTTRTTAAAVSSATSGHKMMRRRSSSSSSSLLFLLLLTMTAFPSLMVSAAENLYTLLGISRKATLKEIKKAYRAKSLEFHPDKNKAEGASAKFAEIARAYEVLSDEEKRQIYDRHGEEGLKNHEQHGGGGHHGGGFDDIFSQFFGGRGQQRRDQEQRTESVQVPLHLSLRQLFLGETLEVAYVRQVLCLQWEMCVKQAPDCQGPGIRVRRQQIAPGFVQQVQQHDERCVARGKMWKQGCRECPEKTVEEKIDLTVDIAPGMREGEAVSFEETTDEKPGFKAGDLHFVIYEEPHPVYHREGHDLYMTQEVPLVDALTGFSLSLERLDGETFTVNVDDVTDCDHVMRVPGKGMPHRGRPHRFGDLYITFEVEFPDELTNEQKKQIRRILGEENGDDRDDDAHGDDIKEEL